MRVYINKSSSMFKYMVLLLALSPITFCFFSRHINNVCKSFIDYYYPDDNENCYYDPDTTLDTPELIEKYAGSVEIHDVTTEDGYILTLFRIPRTDPKEVILLHHSIGTYSHIYLWQGNNSLAITLWRDGFDVWLANQRGTTNSDKHVNLTNNDFRYWNFSFHEMGIYDVSSELELIREKTNGSKVIFFGHSLGSAIGLVYSSLKFAEAQNYLKSMILLAAPCYFEHATSFVMLFKKFGPILEVFVNSLQLGCCVFMLPSILPISRTVLRLFPAIIFIVNMMVWAFCGYTPLETDPTFFNFDGLIYGNNFSWKTLLHFIQLTNTEHRFQMFDYGTEENLKIYGEATPPVYPIEKISVPTLLVSSYNDSLVSLEDCDSLFEELNPEAKIYGHWKVSGLNHLDYHIGLQRKELFVDHLLTFLNNL